MLSLCKSASVSSRLIGQSSQQLYNDILVAIPLALVEQTSRMPGTLARPVL